MSCAATRGRWKVKNKKRLISKSKIKKLLNTGPTTVTGAGEATVKGKGGGGLG